LKTDLYSGIICATSLLKGKFESGAVDSCAQLIRSMSHENQIEKKV
jgi:hypothetical protein